MSEVSLPTWAIIIYFFGLMCADAFYLGRFSGQAVLRQLEKTERCLYRKWGVEQDLFWGGWGIRFICWSIGLAILAVCTIYAAFLSTYLISGTSRDLVEQIYYTFGFFLIALLLGVAMELERIKYILQKVKRLEDLRPVFHNRFRPSDLLSVYESLKFAPPLFWKEYSQLTDEEVNKDINQEYRDKGAPYRYSLSIRHTRVTISLGVLAIAITTVVAVGDFLW